MLVRPRHAGDRGLPLLLAGVVIAPLLAVVAGDEGKTTHALVEVVAPEDLVGFKSGIYALFSRVPRIAEEVVTWTPTSDPLGCSHYDAPTPAIPAMAVVVRSGNCTFVEKAMRAYEAGAKGVVILSRSEQEMVMRANSTGDEEEAEGLGIIAVSVRKAFGEKVIKANEARSPGEGVRIRLSVYEQSFWDISMVLIMILAVVLVAAGASFATADLHTGTRMGAIMAPHEEEVLEVDSSLSIGFCLVGSCVLVVLFFFMWILIYVIIFMFCFAGAFNIQQQLRWMLEYYIPMPSPAGDARGGLSSRIHKQLCNIDSCGPVYLSDLIAAIPGLVVVVCWLLYRDTSHGFIYQDIIGAGFLCMIQRTMRLPNMKVATVLLVVMFAFDIFWVFLSPFIFRKSVMVEVATGGGTGMTVPLLLRVPSFGDPLGNDRMLGFGDIALPGLLVSYLRRFDVVTKKGPLRGYFVPSLVGYTVGLFVTMVALSIMKMGQPALLYLVPGVLGTTMCLGYARGEISRLWEGPGASGPRPGRDTRELGEHFGGAGAGGSSISLPETSNNAPGGAAP